MSVKPLMGFFPYIKIKVITTKVLATKYSNCAIQSFILHHLTKNIRCEHFSTLKESYKKVRQTYGKKILTKIFDSMNSCLSEKFELKLVCQTFHKSKF
jgi:hypothetical protein